MTTTRDYFNLYSPIEVGNGMQNINVISTDHETALIQLLGKTSRLFKGFGLKQLLQGCYTPFYNVKCNRTKFDETNDSHLQCASLVHRVLVPEIFQQLLPWFGSVECQKLVDLINQGTNGTKKALKQIDQLSMTDDDDQEGQETFDIREDIDTGLTLQIKATSKKHIVRLMVFGATALVMLPDLPTLDSFLGDYETTYNNLKDGLAQFDDENQVHLMLAMKFYRQVLPTVFAKLITQFSAAQCLEMVKNVNKGSADTNKALDKLTGDWKTLRQTQMTAILPQGVTIDNFVIQMGADIVSYRRIYKRRNLPSIADAMGADNRVLFGQLFCSTVAKRIAFNPLLETHMRCLRRVVTHLLPYMDRAFA